MRRFSSVYGSGEPLGSPLKARGSVPRFSPNPPGSGTRAPPPSRPDAPHLPPPPPQRFGHRPMWEPLIGCARNGVSKLPVSAEVDPEQKLLQLRIAKLLVDLAPLREVDHQLPEFATVVPGF